MEGDHEHIDSMDIPREANVAIIVPANGLPRDHPLCRGECPVWWTEHKSAFEQIHNLPTTTKLFYLTITKTPSAALPVMLVWTTNTHFPT